MMKQFTSKPSQNDGAYVDGRFEGRCTKQNQLESPWLKPGDIGVEELTEYGEHDVSLDPVTIYFQFSTG